MLIEAAWKRFISNQPDAINESLIDFRFYNQPSLWEALGYHRNGIYGKGFGDTAAQKEIRELLIAKGHMIATLKPRFFNF